jgi:hypothetical protein
MNEPQSQATQAAVFTDTIALLEQCAAYLKRMPPVAVTLMMLRDIENHLAQPETSTAKRLASINARELELRHQVRSVRTFATSGVPLLEVQVCGDHVRISTHETYLREGLDRKTHSAETQTLLNMLTKGVELELKVDEKASAQRRWSEP